MMHRRLTSAAIAFVLSISVGILGGPIPAATAAGPMTGPDHWYEYTGAKSLADYKPGDVIKTRTFQAHVFALPTEVKTIQIQYRSTDALGRPTANITSLLIPPGEVSKDRLVSYNSFYDSMNPDDSPSRYIHGDITLGGLPNVPEGMTIAPMLTHGTMVAVPDTEGQKADFAVGPVYGMNTLDSIRAIRQTNIGGVASDAKVGMIGYSGGAIATNWAAALAPSYAPDVNKDLIGAAEGGVLVNPATNLRYISGSLMWAGVAGMAIVGLSRAYGVSMEPYMSDYAKSIFAKFQVAGIADVLLAHPWLAWEHVVKPEYRNPNSIKDFVDIANKVNLGSAPTPTTPMMIMQGSGGWTEGTGGNIPGVGPGDGVMVAGDVRALAKQYCEDGATIQYDEVPFGHVATALVWGYPAYQWLKDRFDGKPAPSNCADIKPGNSLAPQVYQPPTLPSGQASPAPQFGVDPTPPIPEPSTSLGPAPRVVDSTPTGVVLPPATAKVTKKVAKKVKKVKKKKRAKRRARR